MVCAWKRGQNDAAPWGDVVRAQLEAQRAAWLSAVEILGRLGNLLVGRKPQDPRVAPDDEPPHERQRNEHEDPPERGHDTSVTGDGSSGLLRMDHNRRGGVAMVVATTMNTAAA